MLHSGRWGGERLVARRNSLESNNSHRYCYIWLNSNSPMAANSRFAVAVHVAALLAHREALGQQWVSSSELADSVRTNPVVVRRALGALVKAGLVRTQPGRRGGARLARSPEVIPLSEIYHAVEPGDSVLAPNPNPTQRTCPVSSGIGRALTPIFVDVESAVEETLGRSSLADILGMIEATRAALRGGQKW